VALLLGFHLRMGVEGLYLGVILGPIAQWVCYTVLVYRLDWKAEAELAHRHMLEVAASRNGMGWHMAGCWQHPS